jgi:hypothetical protein
MILAGLALAGFVWASWPEPTTRVVLLPAGESLPKAPLAAAAEPAAPVQVAATQPEAPAAQAAPVAEGEGEQTARELAVVEPEAAFDAGAERMGPAPVPSELEQSGAYEPESPEELGAAPLPGFDVTPAPPVAG